MAKFPNTTRDTDEGCGKYTRPAHIAYAIDASGCVHRVGGDDTGNIADTFRELGRELIEDDAGNKALDKTCRED